MTENAHFPLWLIVHKLPLSIKPDQLHRHWFTEHDDEMSHKLEAEVNLSNNSYFGSKTRRIRNHYLTLIRMILVIVEQLKHLQLLAWLLSEYVGEEATYTAK